MEAIYAVDINNGLAKDGNIPWNIKDDMKFFYNITKNNIVLMGKNTYLSLPNRPLKNRLNIVLTNDKGLLSENIDNVIFINNISIINEIKENNKKYSSLYNYLREDYKIIIIGGREIYKNYLNLCNIIWETRIKKDYECDIRLVEYDKSLYEEEIIEDNEEYKIIKYKLNS